MQQPTTAAPAPSFAGLLATLAGSAQRPAPVWNDDDLADDVATLSYGNALKAHSRNRFTDQSLPPAVDPGPYRIAESSPATLAAEPQSKAQPDAGRNSPATPDLESNRLRTAQTGRNLKDASITIRMSKAECAQLHKRAAEAGVTVSAYLRSCTFEAESLRAMVKETLVQLRASSTQANLSKAAPLHRTRFGGLARIFTPWRRNQRVSRA